MEPERRDVTLSANSDWLETAKGGGQLEVASSPELLIKSRLILVFRRAGWSCFVHPPNLKPRSDTIQHATNGTILCTSGCRGFRVRRLRVGDHPGYSVTIPSEEPT